MQPKIWLTRAGVAALSESLSMTDPEWARFIFDRFPSSAAEANEKGCCPQCGGQPVEAMGGMFIEEPASTPDRVEGWVYIECLCRALYRFRGVESVDVSEPIGRAVVRVAVPPTVPAEPLPPGANTTLDEANRIASRRSESVRDSYFPYIHAATRLYYSHVPHLPPEDKK